MTTRRALLWGGAAMLFAGCSGQGSPIGGPDEPHPPDAGGCRAVGELVEFDRIGAAEVYYTGSGRPAPMKLEPGFLAKVEAWAAEWTVLSGLGAMQRLVSYGGYVDKCSSYHQIGQAFDISEVVHASGTVSLRYDQWAPGSPAQLRDYWRFAASTHLHFAYTLTHTFDAAHHNHVHVDNLVSADGLSLFTPRSGTQVQLLVNLCRHVFGVDLPDTDSWDEPLRAAVAQVQQRLGITMPLARVEGWHAFLRAAARG